MSRGSEAVSARCSGSDAGDAAVPGSVLDRGEPGERLRGVGVLIPAASRLADLSAALLRQCGARVFQAPAIASAAVTEGDAERLREEGERLVAGAYDWLILTSPRTVAAIAAVLAQVGVKAAGASARVPAFPVPSRTRVAVIGGATAAALEQLGAGFDFVPTRASGHGLAAELPAEPGECILLPQSAIAHTTIADRLRQRGCEVTSVSAYRTVDAGFPAPLLAAVREGAVQLAVVTSGSVGRSLARQLGPWLSGIQLVSIGAQTSDDLRAAGLAVAAQAVRPSAESLVDAVVAVVSGCAPCGPHL